MPIFYRNRYLPRPIYGLSSPFMYGPTLFLNNPAILNQTQNTGNIDINITKRTDGTSELTATDIAFLRTKISMLNNIYNIILKHLCIKRSSSSPIVYDLLGNISGELYGPNQDPSVKDHTKELCLSGSAAVLTYGTTAPNPAARGANLVRDAATAAAAAAAPPATAASVAAAALAQSALITVAVGYTVAEQGAAVAVNLAIAAEAVRAGGVAPTAASVVAVALAAAAPHNVPVLAIPGAPGAVVNNKYPTGECITPMFSPTQLQKLITAMDTNNFLGKACLYKDSTRRYRTNINILGGAYGGAFGDAYEAVANSATNSKNMSFINLKDIMQENSERSESSSMLCVQIDGKLKCSNLKKQSNVANRKCDFCDKWTNERKMFRSVINDLLNAGNMDDTCELMKESSHLIPSVIMNQEQYHKFFSKIEEYKKARREGQL
jgi:hypothetical protein